MEWCKYCGTGVDKEDDITQYLNCENKTHNRHAHAWCYSAAVYEKGQTILLCGACGKRLNPIGILDTFGKKMCLHQHLQKMEEDPASQLVAMNTKMLCESMKRICHAREVGISNITSYIFNALFSADILLFITSGICGLLYGIMTQNNKPDKWFIICSIIIPFVSFIFLFFIVRLLEKMISRSFVTITAIIPILFAFVSLCIGNTYMNDRCFDALILFSFLVKIVRSFPNIHDAIAHYKVARVLCGISISLSMDARDKLKKHNNTPIISLLDKTITLAKIAGSCTIGNDDGSLERWDCVWLKKQQQQGHH
jgi:hypothetical protein